MITRGALNVWCAWLLSSSSVLHDLHGLSRPPPNPEVEKVGTVPIFEKLFSKEVLGVPDAFETKEGCLVLPLLPLNE
ncbi:hypothetical protein MRX96_048506, partial [Rhipicephalus microplus]